MYLEKSFTENTETFAMTKDLKRLAIPISLKGLKPLAVKLKRKTLVMWYL